MFAYVCTILDISSAQMENENAISMPARYVQWFELYVNRSVSPYTINIIEIFVEVLTSTGVIGAVMDPMRPTMDEKASNVCLNSVG